MNVNLTSLYWICNQFGGTTKKWTSLIHNGVLFPPEYVPHNIPVYYNGLPIQLNIIAEEAATFYAKYIGTEYIDNPKFRKNFWKDWVGLIGPNTPIQSLDGCDFSKIKAYLDKQKEEKANGSEEEKAKAKALREQEDEKYKYAYIDGKQEPVGNFRVEPPGIFIGRGTHPLIGMIKKRIYPEDITLNLSADAPIPVTLPGHSWGKIVHDRTVDWLASWKDTISGKTKYVWLGAQSSVKAQSDMEKYELARKLKKKIVGIRDDNFDNMKNPNDKVKQLATAVYLIDTFALRVGGEKGSDEADTVGVTSLRVEHVFFMGSDTIKLDFLGKDSVRYLNTVEVAPIVYKNLSDFTDGKEKYDVIFDKITPQDVNKYLQTWMKDLTAKVFRTFNASALFSKELSKITNKYSGYTGDDKIKILLDEFNKANIKVAKLCNHQKNVSKSFSDQLDKMNEQIKKLKTQYKKSKKESTKKKILALKTKKEIKSEMKNISLGTSKINYIDPRITVAFIKANGIPPEKLFTKALMDKFKWAFDVDPDYKF